MVEIGPQRTLASMGAACAAAGPQQWVSVVEKPSSANDVSRFRELVKQIRRGSESRHRWDHKTFSLTKTSRESRPEKSLEERPNPPLSTGATPFWAENWVRHSRIPNNFLAEGPLGQQNRCVLVGVPPQHMDEVRLGMEELGLNSSRAYEMPLDLAELEAALRAGAWTGVLVVAGMWTDTSATAGINETVHILRLYRRLSSEVAVLPPLAVVTKGAQHISDSRQTGSSELDSMSEASRHNDNYTALSPHAGLMAFCRTSRLETERLGSQFGIRYFDVEPRPGVRFPEQLASVLYWLSRSAKQNVGAVGKDSVEQGTDEVELVVRQESYYVPRAAPLLLRSPTTRTTTISSEKSYVVSGGSAGIGLVLAGWLLQQGAGKLVLLSRSGAVAEGQKNGTLWGDLQAAVSRGRVQSVKCDVSRIDQVRAAIVTAADGHAVGGIFHCAGVEGKHSFWDASESDIDAVYDPKVKGAWNLHRVCEEMNINRNLDEFVMFSSISALPGNDAFALYASANGCLDALAQYRRSLGLPARSIRWGPWLETGMASRSEAFGRFMKSRGITGFSNNEALGLLETVLGSDLSLVTVCHVEWRKYATVFGRNIPPWLSEVLRGTGETCVPVEGNESKERGWQLSSEGVETAVMEVARKLCGETSGISSESSIDALGLDSLGALEFRNALQDALSIKLPASLLVEFPTLKDVIDFIVRDCFSPETEARAVSPVTSEGDTAASANVFAVVGMACRVPPNANSPGEFWQLLVDAVDAVREIPMERFNIDAFYDPDPAREKCYTREAALLENADMFDNDFFGLKDSEVLTIDPQQRMLLEVAYEAFLDGGYSRDMLAGKNFGVFCASYNNDFQFTNLTGGKAAMCVDSGPGCVPSLGEASGYPEPGGFMCFIPNRLSFNFGLIGPSIGIDAACASALVAFDSAITKLKARSCDGALVGGVNIILSPAFFLGGCKTRQFSHAGRCLTFDKDADGLVRGEGCGAVVLLPLTTAREKGMVVQAVVRGSATSHYGRSGRITAPNTRALARVLRLALEDAKTPPSSVRYYEAHGTATVLGDIIEMSAVREVFQRDRTPATPLHVGTVHNNIGHLDAAAGIVAFIKTVLCLKHKFVPSNIHFKALHPDIQGIDSNLIIYTRGPQQIVQPNPGTPLLGANLAYGMGGSIAAVITEAGDEGDGTEGQRVMTHTWHHRRFPLNSQKFVFLMGAVAQISMDELPTPQADVIHALQSLSDTTINVEYLRTLLPAKQPHEIRSVFLTGATGFIGSQVLLHLLELRQNAANLKVFCLVRARDQAHGAYRIKDSLVGRGLQWKPEYDLQVIPVVGNLEERGMGIGEKQMEFLLRAVDAVYHAADSVKLDVPYDRVRKANVVSLTAILKLCTTFRSKPLHLVSNFAHYLQYFAAFSGDLNVPVGETVSPPLSASELERLEQRMPAGIVGYPWCKWAVEAIIGHIKVMVQERCHEAGLDGVAKEEVESKLQMTVYRFPNSCVYYGNGYTNFTNPFLAVVLACAQEQMIPPGVLPVGAPFLTTPVDLAAALLVQLSRSTSRKHDVYNLVSLRAIRRQQVLEVAQRFFGSVAECTVDDLLRRLDDNKEDSPVRQLRPLIRYWRKYWFSDDTDRDSLFPIAVTHANEDLPHSLDSFPEVWQTWLRMAAYCVTNYHMVRDPFNEALPFDLLKSVISFFRRTHTLPPLAHRTEELLEEAAAVQNTTDQAARKALEQYTQGEQEEALFDVAQSRACG
ncbi:type i fatty acid [Cystoisospora suis]|uniref:Type i fatty acid n=1 Tax=Cystoisospora suis TaxID=483139 RepID=A0A2C6KTL8_9APIC|nr:type i fatty acid [Cystoisospora suis]